MDKLGLFLAGYFLLAIFAILPYTLYLCGKTMKIQNEKFTFLYCIWINIVAIMFAGIANISGKNWISYVVFIVVLGLMIKDRDHTIANNALAVMVAANTAIAIGLYSLIILSPLILR